MQLSSLDHPVNSVSLFQRKLGIVILLAITVSLVLLLS